MTRYEEMMNKALEMLKEDDDLFCEMVDELDSWNGYADGFRCYYMSDIDELFCGVKIGDFLDKLCSTFNHNDEYFIDTIYGLDSTNDKAGHYRDNVDEGELLDNIIDKASHIYFSNSEFEELIDSIINYTDEEEEEEQPAA